MKICINKTKAIAIIVLATLMTSTFMLMSIAPVQAQQTTGPIPAGETPDGTVDTQIYLSFRPNPVGLNQIFLVNLYTAPAPGANRLHEDFTVTITKPSGEVYSFTIDSYPDDGTAWFEWIADEIGDWTIQFDFLGTYYPAGIYMDGEMVAQEMGRSTTTYTESVYFEPKSTGPQTLTVQEEMVYSWPEAELPTDYWTRPVAYENREWWPILGDYPWRGPATDPLFEEMYPNTNPVGIGGSAHNYFTAWVEGPESAHVVWKRECQISGLLGGDQGVKPAEANLFAGNGMGSGAYANGKPDVIYQGKAYEVVTTNAATMVDGEIKYVPTTMMQCYDIRTGEVFWETSVDVASVGFGPYPTTYFSPTEIEYEGIANPGGGGDTQQSASVSLITIASGHLMKWRPMTGEMFLDVSIAPVSSATYYRNGYCLSVQNLGGEYRLLNWTTFGTSASFASRVVSNITWPYSSVPATTDYNVGIASTQTTVSKGGAYVGLTISAASLTTGDVLWEKTFTDVTQYSGNTNCADHGKIAVLTVEGPMKAWNLADGSLAWTSEPLEYPWDEPGFGAYAVHSAYGKLIRPAYSGIYAFNWDDGSLAWKYETPAEFPYETPYINEEGETMYSWNIGGTIADGNLYIYNTEHSATVPITRGWKMHAIDIATGDEVWSVMIAGGSSKHTSDLGPVADGYLTLAASDGYMYVFGKGQSETTVTAPDVAVPKGTTMIIKGTVLDMSPAQPGTPCVSVNSMGAQMEYIHHQMPLEGIHGDRTIEGVEVLLTAIGTDGSCIDLGTTVTNGYYGTFTYAWTPETEGTYEIIASFAGDASYGSSAAATGVVVGPAATAGGTIEPEHPIISTEVAIIIAVVAITAIGAAAFLALRKRK